MHILGGLVALIGVVALVLYRLHMAAEAAKGLGEAAGEVRGLFRRAAWRKRTNVDQLAAVDDARLAAVAMMAALAESDGAMTEPERQRIEGYATDVLGADAKLATELLAHARWLVRDIRDVDEALRKLTPVIKRSCTAQQVTELLDMLDRVAAVSGAPGGIERRALERLGRALKS